MATVTPVTPPKSTRIRRALLVAIAALFGALLIASANAGIANADSTGPTAQIGKVSDALPAFATVDAAGTERTEPVVPTVQLRTHTVQSGETVCRIGLAYGIKPCQPMADVNKQLTDINVIHPGDKVNLPEGAAAQPDMTLLKVVVPTAYEVSAKDIAKKTEQHTAPAKPKDSGTTAGNSIWDRLMQCEGGRFGWSANTGNGFKGGLQFTDSTWKAFGGTGSADKASRAEQIRVGKNVLEGQGPGAWPVCSKKVGLTKANGLAAS